VFTDAAREAISPAGNVTAISVEAAGDGVAALWFGLGSPYDRATYRYTPFLAWLAIPNILLFFAWGKVAFSFVDVSVGSLIRQSLEARGVAKRAAQAYACLWWFSPVAMNISTRGSADCIAVALCLAAMNALLRRRDVEAAIWLGAAVHFKIYPAIFAVPMALFIDHHYDGAASSGREPGMAESVSSVVSGVVRATRLQRRTFNALAADSTETHKADDGDEQEEEQQGDSTGTRGGGIRSSSTSRARRRRPAAAAPSAPGTPLLLAVDSPRERIPQAALTERVWDRLVAADSPSAWVRGFLRWRRVRFGLVALGVCASLTGAAWALYGDRCIHDAYLYHFGRTDPRHNFSPYFYALYLTDGGGGGGSGGLASAQSLGLAAFVPQLAVVLAAGFLLYRDLPLAMTVQAIAFVAFNKVCTAQYFLWWQGLVPVAAASLFAASDPAQSGRVSWLWWWMIMASWFGGQVNWLLWASELEEAGRAVFLPLWGAGIVFLACNTLLMLWLVAGRGIPVMFRGQTVRLGRVSNGGAIAWIETAIGLVTDTA
jgi:phosphatidylinositol glycan class M